MLLFQSFKVFLFILFFTEIVTLSCFCAFGFELKKEAVSENIGLKVSEIINVGVPFGAQRIAIYLLSDRPEVQDIANSVIKVLSKDQVRSIFMANKVLLSNKDICRRCRSRFNIIFLDSFNLENVWDIIETESPLSIFTPKVPVLIISTDASDVNTTKLKENFEKLFDKNLLNIFWIHLNSKDLTVRGFDYNPFDKTGVVTEIPLFSTPFNTSHFEKDQDLRGYPLRFVTYNDPPKSYNTFLNSLKGYEGMFIRLICEKINAKPKVRRLHKRKHLLKESLQLLMDNEADMTVNPLLFLSRDYSNATIDFIYPQVLESLNLLVPAKTNFPWGKKSIFRPFRYEIWIALLVTLILFTCIWFSLNIKQFGRQKTYVVTFFEVLRVFTGGLSSHPMHSLSERFLFSGYILFVFLIINGYQTALISILTSPEPKSYFTLAEVNSSTDIHFILQSKYEVSRHLTTEYLQQVMNNHFEVENVNLWDMSNLEHNHSHAYLAPKRDAEFLVNSVANRDHNGAMVFHLLPQGLLYSIETYAVKKNFVLEKKISSIVERVRQTGLFEWFQTVSFFEARQLGLLSKEQLDGYEKVRVVTFDSLKSAFVLLVVGYVLSIIVFICEILFPRRRSITKKTKVVVRMGNVRKNPIVSCKSCASKRRHRQKLRKLQSA